MRSLVVTVIVVLAAGGLGACQGTAAPGARGGPWYSDIPIGSTLQLLRPVTIATERVSTGLPRVGPGAGAGEYAPNCRLELFDRNQTTVVVEPDTFVVTKVRGGFTSILAGRPQPVLVASAGGFMPSLAKGSEGSSYLKSYAQLYLKSERQPNVFRVECSYMDDPWEVELLTLAELRQALAGVFVLELAPPGS